MAVLQLIVYKNNVVTATVSKTFVSNSSSLLKSLDYFQQEVNATLSKLIEDHGDSVDTLEEDGESENDDDNEDLESRSIKKMKM